MSMVCRTGISPKKYTLLPQRGKRHCVQAILPASYLKLTCSYLVTLYTKPAQPGEYKMAPAVRSISSENQVWVSQYDATNTTFSVPCPPKLRTVSHCELNQAHSRKYLFVKGTGPAVCHCVQGIPWQWEDSWGVTRSNYDLQNPLWTNGGWSHQLQQHIHCKIEFTRDMSGLQ